MDDLEELVLDFQRDYARSVVDEMTETPMDMDWLFADLDASTPIDLPDDERALDIPWDFLNTSSVLDDVELNIDWDNLESIIIPETVPRALSPDEESVDSSTLMQHPLFPRLTAAITACKDVGRSTAKGNAGCTGLHVRHLWQQQAYGMQPETTLDDFMETYCLLFEGVYTSLQEFDERLQQTLKLYHREIIGGLNVPHSRGHTGRSDQPLLPDKAELRDRHREIIQELKKKILQKRKKSRLSDNAVKLLRSWWEKNTAYPYPTEAVKEALGKQTGLTMVQVNNWFINRRKRSKPNGIQ